MTETESELVLVYIVVATLVVLSAKAVQLGFMNLFDRDPRSRAPAARAAEAGLEVGTLPRGRALLAVGYLRAGLGGVADALLARAAAEGWLISLGKGGALDSFDLPATASRESAALKAQLRSLAPLPSELQRSAVAIGRGVAPDLDAALVRDGLLFGSTQRVTGACVYGFLVLAVVAAGVSRGLGDGAVQAGPLIAAAVVGAVAARFAKADARTREAKRYLDWLRDATDALRLDVREGRTTEPADLELIGAVYGAEALPLFAKSVAEERRAAEA